MLEEVVEHGGETLADGRVTEDGLNVTCDHIEDDQLEPRKERSASVWRDQTHRFDAHEIGVASHLTRVSKGVLEILPLLIG